MEEKDIKTALQSFRNLTRCARDEGNRLKDDLEDARDDEAHTDESRIRDVQDFIEKALNEIESAAEYITEAVDRLKVRK